MGLEHGRRLLLVGWLSVLLLGCGVSSQSQPIPLPVQVSSIPPTARAERNAYSITVYFVQFGRLAPVSLPAPDSSTLTALRLLVEGPNATEAAMGLETALVPQHLDVVADSRTPLTVEASREFTSIAGDNQLLAAAQLVWTATNNSPNTLVRITVEGKPIEVPTDDGLSRLAVGRGDYTTVAPAEQPRTSTPSAAEPTSTPS